MSNQNKTATTGDSDGKEIGLCINCEYALLESTSKKCVLCSKDGLLFTNFKRTIGKTESKLCATCSNNLELPKKKGTIMLNRTDGFPCNVCVNDYFYDQMKPIVS